MLNQIMKQIKSLIPKSWKRTIKKVAGKLSEPKRYKYCVELIHSNRCKKIMEIGTYNGENAMRMIKAAGRFHRPDTIEYYGFDLFELMDEKTLKKEVSKKPPTVDNVKTKLQNTGAQINLFKGFTHQTLPRFISTMPVMDFILIDGGHSINTISNDWKYAKKLMDQNTLVVFDDYWSGDYGKHKNAGCQHLIDRLDRNEFNVTILPEQDIFQTKSGTLKINYVLVKKALAKNHEIAF